MGTPSIPTIKRLFSLSGNRCAFSGCRIPLVDSDSGKVVGKMCHIRANSPRGPRYDPSQSEEVRQAFENLLLLCPMHHDVVDADPETYTAARLQRMKENHEASQKPRVEPNDEVARQLAATVHVDSVKDASVIFSFNQGGGQVAHSITNIGYQPKQIPQHAVPEFLHLMKSLPPMKIHITANILDPQTQFLANQLADLLQTAGWNASGESLSLYPGLPKGIVFLVPESMRESLSLDIVAKFLKALGFTNYRVFNKDQNLVTIVINAV
jgi:hypothetical protein